MSRNSLGRPVSGESGGGGWITQCSRQNRVQELQDGLGVQMLRQGEQGRSMSAEQERTPGVDSDMVIGIIS